MFFSENRFPLFRNMHQGTAIAAARYAHMLDPAHLLIEPELHMRDGRIIRSLADAIALVREHEGRPGVDARDEVLHQLERARTDRARQQAAAAFLAWAEGLELVVEPAETARRSS
jgi:hypothetical protein